MLIIIIIIIIIIIKTTLDTIEKLKEKKMTPTAGKHVRTSKQIHINSLHFTTSGINTQISKRNNLNTLYINIRSQVVSTAWLVTGELWMLETES